MTNKDTLISLSAEDFYRKVKHLFKTMNKQEIIEYLNTEYIKPTNTKAKHHRDQLCPHCGQQWTWSQRRWNIVNTTGKLVIPCKRCHKYFVAYEKESSNTVTEK